MRVRAADIGRYYDSFLEGSSQSLVMELCDNGDLMEYWKEARTEGRVLLEEEIMDKFVQVREADEGREEVFVQLDGEFFL
jgi:serine/threonine protein kinase